MMKVSMLAKKEHHYNNTMNKYILIAVSILTALTAVSCASAQRAKVSGLGSEHRIEMYSGGVKVREWTSTGKLSSEEKSDGYYFECKATGKLIEVCGDVVVTQL